MKANACRGYHVVPDAEHENRYYLEFPDGLRLIFEDDKYIGYYNCN